MTAKLKRRPSIKGNFRVLVVPEQDITSHPAGVTIPAFYHAARSGFRVVAEGWPIDMSVECSSWAFTKHQRAKVVQNLQYLATWIEKCGKDLDASEESNDRPSRTRKA